MMRVRSSNSNVESWWRVCLRSINVRIQAKVSGTMECQWTTMISMRRHTKSATTLEQWGAAGIAPLIAFCDHPEHFPNKPRLYTRPCSRHQRCESQSIGRGIMPAEVDDDHIAGVGVHLRRGFVPVVCPARRFKHSEDALVSPVKIAVMAMSCQRESTYPQSLAQTMTDWALARARARRLRGSHGADTRS